MFIVRSNIYIKTNYRAICNSIPFSSSIRRHSCGMPASVTIASISSSDAMNDACTLPNLLESISRMHTAEDAIAARLLSTSCEWIQVTPSVS